MNESDIVVSYIKQKRIEKGISQDELAHLSDVDKREIQEFEAMNYPDINVEKAFSICRVLNLISIPLRHEEVEKSNLINKIYEDMKGLSIEELELYRLFIEELFKKLHP